MEHLKDYSKTELLHHINDIKKQHEFKKSEMKYLLDEVQKLDFKITKVTGDLDRIENSYVKLMEEYTSRE